VTSQPAAADVQSAHLGSDGSAEFLNGWIRRVEVR
jgi:hypothetical protein